MKKILPGPKHNIDYKANKYEILDEFDESDYNKKEDGGRSHDDDDDPRRGRGGRGECWRLSIYLNVQLSR